MQSWIHIHLHVERAVIFFFIFYHTYFSVVGGEYLSNDAFDNVLKELHTKTNEMVNTFGQECKSAGVSDYFFYFHLQWYIPVQNYIYISFDLKIKNSENK